jgi:alkylation response protein AidB-like acyl-CoA dehydrogenase
MEPKFYSKDNLKFLLHEVFNVGQLCGRRQFENHSPESFDMMLDAAGTLAERELRPLLLEMDRNPPYLENGQIKVHPKMRGLMKKFGQDGWISMSAPYEKGGQQTPCSSWARLIIPPWHSPF